MNAFSFKLRNRVKQPRDMNILILIYAAIAVLLVLSLILGEKFFSMKSFMSMAYQIPEFGFMALAMAMCMLTGGIDLSIVSTSTLSSILAAYVLIGISKDGGNVTLAILVAILVAVMVSTLCGLVNGLLIAKVSILPILATLSTMIFYSGVAMAITDGAGVVGFPEEFLDLGLLKIFGMPVVFILFVAVAIIVTFILGRTFFGKNIYLYGESKTVALFSGIQNKSLIIKTYMFSGFLCGIAGLIMMARVNSARVGYGETYLLQAILVCVLGGLNPNGGRGKITGVFLGILVLQMLQSGFTLLNFAPYLKKFIWGVVLVAVIIINFYIDKKRKKIKKPKAEAKGARQTVI
jgi:simple sugar transport system permease protein